MKKLSALFTYILSVNSVVLSFTVINKTDLELRMQLTEAYYEQQRNQDGINNIYPIPLNISHDLTLATQSTEVLFLTKECPTPIIHITKKEEKGNWFWSETKEINYTGSLPHYYEQKDLITDNWGLLIYKLSAEKRDINDSFFTWDEQDYGIKYLTPNMLNNI